MTADRLTPQREAEIAEHLAATTNWSIGNLAARDLLAELAAVRAERDEARARAAELEKENAGLGDLRIRAIGKGDKLRAERDDALAELERADNDVIGANLSRWEEEQDSARLRLALKSARRWRQKLRARVAELEALTPAPIQTCRVCNAGYTYGEPCSNCEFNARMARETGGAR